MIFRRILAAAVLIIFSGSWISAVNAQETLSIRDVLLLCISSHKDCLGGVTSVENKVDGTETAMVEISKDICTLLAKKNPDIICSGETADFYGKDGPKLMYIDWCPIGGKLCDCYFNSVTGNTGCQELY